MSNVGKWDKHYAGNNGRPMHYGNSQTYRLGGEALADCAVVEDWGCGLGWFKQYLSPTVRYIGVDGSRSPHAEIIDDLVLRRSEVEGVYMRGILEHNYDWELILDNALASYTKRFVLVTFTPFTKTKPHRELRFEDDYGVPTLALNLGVILEHIVGHSVTHRTLESPETFYGTETFFVVEHG